MTDGGARSSGAWPELPWREWEPTISTLHRWVQIVGKVRMALVPPLNHWWHVPFAVSARGITTSAIPYGDGLFQVDFDFVDHRLVVNDNQPGSFTMALEPRSVAQFYDQFMAGLAGRGIDVAILPRPVELADATPFAMDEDHASYDPVHAESVWRGLAAADRVLGAFQSGFVGKASPVQLYWGGFDLAVSRFSGRQAPKHPGGIPNVADWVMEEAYSHELWTAGWWPLSEDPGPSFFAYAYPEPAGYREATVRPSGARFDPDLGEFLLSYDVVRETSDPAAAVIEFLQSTYEAAADLSSWDRPELEAAELPGRPPRRPWSIRF